MSGVMLFENILAQATILPAYSTAENTDRPFVNLFDGRLDTVGEIDELYFDLQGPDESYTASAKAVDLSSGPDQLEIIGFDRRPVGYWNDYVFEVTTGATAGERRRITDYDYATNVITLESALTASGSEDYALYSVPDFDTIAVFGHDWANLPNLSNPTLIVSTSDTEGGTNNSEEIYGVLDNGVFVYEFESLPAARYLKLELYYGAANPRLNAGLIYLGAGLELGSSYDHFALRAPFSPPGIMQPQKPTVNRNNNNLPFPASVRDEPFDVALDFRYLSEANLRSAIQRGMAEKIQTQPFFVAWDTDNHGLTDAYHDAAICWLERDLQTPRINDFQRFMNWRIQAKGLAR